MSNDRLKYLLENYAEDRLTSEEIRELFAWIKQSEDDRLLKEKISQLWDNHEDNSQFSHINWQEIYDKAMKAPEVKRRPIWWRVAAAAIVSGILIAGSYFLLLLKSTDPEVYVKSNTLPADVSAPESNRATITLSDGTIVDLDSAGNGQVAMQTGVRIIKLENGKIGYQSDPEFSGSLATVFNTLTNPKGSKIINMKLSDGTMVWLNAGSSLTYPVLFSKQDREVKIEGEAFFDVVRDEAKPFFVSNGSVQVQVLGTQFNVNGYQEEKDIKVTLLEGSVKITGFGQSRTLLPGQQVEVMPGAEMLVHSKVDLDAVMAWKNGRFNFQGDNIQSVMRQLARWYDLEVDYEGEVSNEKFVGMISRSRYQNISQILDMFEKTRIVKFTIHGRKVVVRPYE